MLPHPRRITVAGKAYPYILKGGKGRLRKTSGPTISLTIDMGASLYIRYTFQSKKWKAEHDTDLDIAPEHKASFKPSDVATVIQTYREHQELPKGFELPDWSLC